MSGTINLLENTQNEIKSGKKISEIIKDYFIYFNKAYNWEYVFFIIF